MAHKTLTEEEKKLLLERAYAEYLKQNGIKEDPLSEVDKPVDSINVKKTEDSLQEAKLEAIAQAERSAVATEVEQPKESVKAKKSSKDSKADKADKAEKKADKKASKKERKKESKLANKKENKVAKKDKKPKKPKKHPIVGEGESHNPINLIRCFFTWLIDAHDRIQERIDDHLIEAGHSIGKEYHDALARYRGSRKRISYSLLLITLVCGVELLVFNQVTVYQYAYNGRVLGYVKSQDAVTEVLEVASDNIKANNTDVDVSFKANDNITFQLVTADDKSVDSSDEVVNKLAYMTDIEVDAYGIYEDGVLLTIVDSEAAANGAIEAVKVVRSQPDDGMRLISADFNKSITIEPITALITSVQSEHEAYDTLYKGGEINLWHVVAEGETKSSLCKEYGVEAENIKDSGGTDTAETINPGDKVCIKKTVSPLEVKVVEKGTMAEILPYNKIVEKTDSMYKGMTEVKQAGQEGKQIITGKITKINDTIVKRNLKKTELISEPVDEITLEGTADIPKTRATGSYSMPIRSYTLTSGFGARWGRMHTGLDLAAPTGTSIYAADGGVVTRSSYYGGYGYCIDIDHENGEVTRYGHCSKLLVSAGERVYKGQEIALVGSTGNSTGPHLHFEIIVNGTQIDPAPVLGL